MFYRYWIKKKKKNVNFYKPLTDIIISRAGLVEAYA